MSASYAKVIVNPAAGSGTVSRQWPRLRQQLQRAGLSFDHEFTRYAGHALEIARRSADSGYQVLVAVGGDGTVNGVANGILSSANCSDISLGVLSAGTAHAFALSLGIPEDYASACSRLAGQKRQLIDVGVVRCWELGQPRGRFFVNEASVGLSAEIVAAWKGLPHHFGQRLNLVFRSAAGYRCLARHRNRQVRLRMGDGVETAHICTIVVANGQYIADGMRMAPNARLDDGLLDVVTCGDLARSEVLRIRPALYRGSHTGHHKIREQKTVAVTIESDEKLLVEADGDVLGECPASFSVLPAALSVIV